MTKISDVISMLRTHISNKEHEKALAVSRGDAVAAMTADAELIETKDTVARIETLSIQG